MDTIGSMATQAAKVVWGEGDEHREPVSGVMGDVSKGEPYDAGNMDSLDQRKLDHDRDDEPDGGASVMGDGPRPLEAVAREHGGDASNSSANGTSTGGPDLDDSRAGSNGSKSPKGTGTQHIKTTGFAADGGNFDAIKPGAGREADRLMEKKGAQRDGASSNTSSSLSSGDTHAKDKPSLGERIKDKLHKHRRNSKSLTC